MSTGPGRARLFRSRAGPACRTLLSFERPPAGVPGGGAPRRTLKTAQLATSISDVNGYHRIGLSLLARFDHRQDSKGTWRMPWHQESMKGVDGCDKPR